MQARNSKVTRLDFFVVNGPNNLLGHLALEKMWPTQYKALRDIATEVPVIASSAKVVSSRGKALSQSRHVQQPERTPQTPLKQPHAQLNHS